MKIVMTMVGIALGIAIAVVAGVYGWQQYELSRASIAAPAISPPPKQEQTTVPSPAPSTTAAKLDGPPPANTESSQHVSIPGTPAKSAAPTTSGGNPTGTPSTPSVAVPAPPVPTQQPAPSEDSGPLPEPDVTEVVTPEKLMQLTPGMTESDVQAVMGKEGVATPNGQLPPYTPSGWYEVRWPNADGSYIAALFNEQGGLAHVEPFNLRGAEDWTATPWYAVPNWLNAEMRTTNMPVRLPAVDTVASSSNAYQFKGPLVDANGQVTGTIAGTYYINDPNGRYTRALEGSYRYSLADGTQDANTFEFSE